MVQVLVVTSRGRRVTINRLWGVATLFVATPSLFLTAPVRQSLAQEAWSTGPPLITIGAGPGEERQFHNIESIVVRDSVLYVADRGSAQIRALHRRSGEVLHVGGRPGQGPGEFGWLWWADDCTTESIFAYDAATRRIAMFSAELKHIRTVRVSAPGMTHDGLAAPASSSSLRRPTTLLVIYWTVDVNTRPVSAPSNDGTG